MLQTKETGVTANQTQEPWFSLSWGFFRLKVLRSTKTLIFLNVYLLYHLFPSLRTCCCGCSCSCSCCCCCCCCCSSSFFQFHWKAKVVPSELSMVTALAEPKVEASPGYAAKRSLRWDVLPRGGPKFHSPSGKGENEVIFWGWDLNPSKNDFTNSSCYETQYNLLRSLPLFLFNDFPLICWFLVFGSVFW